MTPESEPFHVLGVSGSLRENSRSALAVAAFLEFAKTHGAETRLLDLRAVELPMYRPNRESASAAETTMFENMLWAGAVVLATPDYHGSMSGAIKNFLDYNWEECSGKLFGYICSSHEKGLTVMDQMRTAVRQCYGWSLPYGVSFHSQTDFDAAGAIVNAQVENRLKMMARDLVVYGSLLHRKFLEDLAGDETRTFAARFRG